MRAWARRVATRITRALLRFAYPEYEAQQEQLLRLRRLMDATAERAAKHAAAQKKQLSELAGAIARGPGRDDVRRIEVQLKGVGKLVERHDRIMRRALHRGDARHEPSREERRAMHRLDRLVAGGRPLLVGPWTGEVGFELLYWIPFVQWIRERTGVDPDRLLVISRGGVSSWYSHISSHYIDAFEFVSTDDFRAATIEAKKQRALTAFDVRLVRQIVRERRPGRVRLLHPHLMYGLFWPFWKQLEPMRRVSSYTKHVPLPAPDPADLPAGLPSDYVAVRFYFSGCFPDTPGNRAFVAEAIRTLSAVTDVVLLNTPFAVDDHTDFTVRDNPRVHTIGHMPPERNLGIQSAVISGARAFVGTYGGYSYLAPLYGVTSLAFYSNVTFFAHHLELAQRVYGRLGTASLVPLDVRDVDLVRTALAGAGKGQPLAG